MLLSKQVHYFCVTDKNNKASNIEYSQQPSENMYGSEATKHYYQVSYLPFLLCHMFSGFGCFEPVDVFTWFKEFGI